MANVAGVGNSLAEQLFAEVSEGVAKNIDQSISYRLVERWVLREISKKMAGQAAKTYQFKVSLVSPDSVSPSEDVIVSPPMRIVNPSGTVG